MRFSLLPKAGFACSIAWERFAVNRQGAICRMVRICSCGSGKMAEQAGIIRGHMKNRTKNKLQCSVFVMQFRGEATRVWSDSFLFNRQLFADLESKEILQS